MGLITQAELARRLGVSQETVRKKVQKGKIHLINGKVDESIAMKEIEANSRGFSDKVREHIERTAVEVASTNELFLKARLENELEKGRILKLERKEKEQSLIPAEKVRESIFTQGRVVRDAMLNIPDRVSSVIATMMDPAEIHAFLTKEIRMAIEDLIKKLKND